MVIFSAGSEESKTLQVGLELISLLGTSTRYFEFWVQILGHL